MGIENVAPEKSVKVTIDKERTIGYSMGAMGYLAEVFGDVPSAFSAFLAMSPTDENGVRDTSRIKLTKTSIDTLGHYVVAGLSDFEDGIGLKEVLKMLDMENLGRVFSAVSQALTNYLPPQKKEGVEFPQKRPRKA